MRDFTDSALRDRWSIAAGMLLTLVLAIAVAALKTPTYAAHTSLLVLMSSEYASRPEPLSTQVTSTMAMERDSIMSSEVNILLSRDLARTVVEKIGLARLYPKLAVPTVLGRLKQAVFRASAVKPEDLAVEQFMRDLVVRSSKKVTY